MNKKKITHGIFYDFSAAFDCVRINILKWKLKEEYFIEGKFLVFIAQYMGSRLSAVIFEGKITKWKEEALESPKEEL